MPEIKITKSMELYLEDTKGKYQTEAGRLSELVQEGIKAEEQQ